MKYKTVLILIAIAAIFCGPATAQMTPWMPWSFLPENLVDEIIGELSGETAMSHMIEMAGYNRNRPESEYSGTFWEAEYVLGKLREYGIAGARIDRFPGGTTFDVTKGEIWEISPRRQKLADFDDVPAMLARNSQSANVTADLVWVGEGRAQDFEGVDVQGKIAVSYAPVGNLIRQADNFGAVGVISVYSPRPTFDPTQIQWASVTPGDNAKFGFTIPPIDGYPLKDRLLRGENIRVNVQVETQLLPYEIQDPTGYIQGSDPNADEIILSAHLFEGYAKQGANDDISGSSVILEIARTLNTLINEGRLPRPKRTIRFLWIPEFSGSRPWVAANPEIMSRTLCNINMDMVGAWLTKNYSTYSVMRTTYGNPHYINDVVENYLRFVGQTNREILQNRRGQKILKPIVAPTGSREPFYWSVETHYGSSDHEVFNALGVRVPGVLMITWPDQWYHTSGDRPDKADPTQLKRAAFISLAAAYTIASADDNMAAKIAGEVSSNGMNRIAHQLARAMEELSLAGVPDFNRSFLKARGYIEAAAINEKATLETTLELMSDSKSMNNYVDDLQKTIDDAKDVNLRVFDAYMEITADNLGIQPVEIALTGLEKEGSNMIAKPNESLKTFSNQMAEQRLGDEMSKYPRNGANVNEINLLINGKNSALDIKKMLDVQYRGTTDLQGVINHLKILELLDMIVM